jgi:hypothetical protein
MNASMQLNLSNSTKQTSQWFAGGLFVFSLVGSIHMSHAKGRYNIQYSHQIQKSKEDFWYTPPQSPVFNELLGS